MIAMIAGGITGATVIGCWLLWLLFRDVEEAMIDRIEYLQACSHLVHEEFEKDTQ